MKKITTNKEMKRQAILQAAQNVFLSEGYVAASMDRIANQAGVTKQTIYRYFSNKIDLFRETLKQMGSHSHANLFEPLELPDDKEALLAFGMVFLRAHLTENHLATMRLLVAESAKAPEIIAQFYSVGPDETQNRLAAFFSQRLGVLQPEKRVALWTAMVLAPREAVLLGGKRPGEQEIEAHVKATVELILTSRNIC